MGYIETIPGLHYISVSSIAHAAATATEDVVEVFIPFKCTLREVYFTPCAAVTGADTNTTHLNVIFRNGDGTGTTELANYDLTLGNDLAKADAYAISTNETQVCEALDVVALVCEKVGTGLAVPAGTFTVGIEPTY